MRIKITMSKVIVISMIVFVSCSKYDSDNSPDKDIYLHIPDAGFESVLVNQGIDSDGVVNQQMLKKDARDVRFLDLTYSGSGTISDLTGIEGFTELEILSAIMHEIERIDLSSNTLLDTAYLMGNKITSIDLSNNSNLTMLDLTSNYLHSITGVSGATRLKDLRLSDNLLEDFSIDNPSVENLLISHNLLKTFDATGAVGLKYVLLRLNRITSLDFSSNTLLENVFVDNNKLDNINIEQNSNIRKLLIHNNTLSELDVSNFQELVKLTVHNNSDLTCIKIQSGQDIPTLSISEYQELSSTCN